MPETHTITKAEAAYMLGVDVRTLSTYQNRDIDPLPIALKGKRGQANRYDPHALVEWKVRQAVGQLTLDEEGRPLDLATERARLARAQAIKTERENALREHKLAPTEIITYVFAEAASQARSIFEGIPKRIKNSLPSLRAKEMKIFEAELNKAREAICNIQVDFSQYES